MLTGWKSVEISDLGKVITGNTPPRKQPELYGDHTLFVKPTDINIGERYCLNPEECYSKAGFKKYSKSLIPKGSTCVVTIGSIGKKIIMAHEDLFINQAMNAVVPNGEYDKSFVFYLLKLNLFQLKTFDSGTASGRENVSKSSFSAIKVKVPVSKKAQRRIASILSAYDDLIENNLERIKLLEEMAQITYEEWFVRMRFPGHEEVEIDSDTGLPEGWRLGTLKNITGFLNGFAFKSSDFTSNGLGVIKIKNIDNGTVNVSDVDYINHDVAKIANKFSLKQADIVIAMTGATVGKVGVIPRIESPYYLNQRVGKFAPLASSDNRYFTYCCLTHDIGYQQVVNIASGAAQPNISGNEILSVKTIVPNDKILNQFHNIASMLFDQIINLRYQNKLLQEARDILLPRLMTGMIDIDKVELPEALLERLNTKNNNETNIG